MNVMNIIRFDNNIQKNQVTYYIQYNQVTYYIRYNQVTYYIQYYQVTYYIQNSPSLLKNIRVFRSMIFILCNTIMVIFSLLYHCTALL